MGVKGSGKDGKDSESKTVAMVVPLKTQNRNNARQTESSDLGDGTFVDFCNKFKLKVASLMIPLRLNYVSHTKWLSIHSGKYFATNVSMSTGGFSCTRYASI